MSHRPRQRIGLLAALVVAGLVVPRHAPGTIAEQRARLPPPAFCQDPVEGIWRSHDFHVDWQEWGIFTLEIRRVEGSATELTRQITNRSWYANAKASEPPPCAGELDYLVTMNARGAYDESGRVEFRGVDWELTRLFCGPRQGFGYNLDVFSGVIDPELQEFQSVNNDGGRYVNVPTVFRRVECFDEIPPTSLAVDVPALTPEPEGPGCAGGR